MQTYLHGELYAAGSFTSINGVAADVRSREFGVNEAATRITGPDRIAGPV